MGGRIPGSVRSQVIRYWLQGLSRDQIAGVNEIGAGTVSAIIKECIQTDPEFALLREVAVLLKDKGLNLSIFGSSVRLRQILEKRNLNEAQIESFIENADIHCFKQGLTWQEFIAIINRVSFLSNKFEIPINELPEYLINLQREVKRFKEEIAELKMEEIRQIEHHKVTVRLLNDYIRNKPSYEKFKAVQMELEKVRKQREYLKLELTCHEELDKFAEEQEWGIDEEELDLANAELRRNLVPNDLMNILKELYYSPNKYTDIIEMILERCPSLDPKPKNSNISS